MAEAVCQSNRPMVAFTIGFDEPSFDETVPARCLADRLGIRHRVERFTADHATASLESVVLACDEPLADPSLLPTWIVSRLAREEVKVVLSGDGGDELLGGYPTYVAHRIAVWYRRIPRPIREGLIRPLANRMPVSHRNFSLDFIVQRFLKGADLDGVERHRTWMGSLAYSQRTALWAPWTWRHLDRSFDGDDAFSRFRAKAVNTQDPADFAMRLDLATYLPDDLLVKVDRMSMDHGLEVRVPWLDPPLVEFALALPARWKVTFGKTKWLVRRAWAGRLPKEILNRPKKGFGIPIAAWLCGIGRPWVHEWLLSQSTRLPFWNQAFIRQVVEEHWLRRRNHAKLIWALLFFQLWRTRHKVE
jgi:asparagine synthase (glutamine-hydrolysing)